MARVCSSSGGADGRGEQLRIYIQCYPERWISQGVHGRAIAAQVSTALAVHPGPRGSVGLEVGVAGAPKPSARRARVSAKSRAHAARMLLSRRSG